MLPFWYVLNIIYLFTINLLLTCLLLTLYHSSPLPYSLLPFNKHKKEAKEEEYDELNYEEEEEEKERQERATQE